MSGDTLVSPFTMTRLQAALACNAVSRFLDLTKQDLKRLAPGSQEHEDARSHLVELQDLHGSLIHLQLGRVDATLAAEACMLDRSLTACEEPVSSETEGLSHV